MYHSNMSRLTVLSFGAGQDSTAILYLLLYSKRFRENYAKGGSDCRNGGNWKRTP